MMTMIFGPKITRHFYLIVCLFVRLFWQAGKVLRQNKTTTIRGYCQTRVNDETDENDLDVSICIDWVEIIKPSSDAETKVFLDYLEHICRFGNTLTFRQMPFSS